MSKQLLPRSQVRWRCHRGMLELDLLLLPFFDQYYDDLSLDQKLQFIQLLECNDPDIHGWLMQLTETTNKEVSGIVKFIRNTF